MSFLRILGLSRLKWNFWISLVIFGYLLLFVLTMNNFFFWDTIHFASRIGNWYYENSWLKFHLPKELDNGHFPIFGIYIAATWRIFGKSLIISHLAMIPFILGVLYNAYKIIQNSVEVDYKGISFAVLLADATLLSQATLVSPDVVLICCFFGAINTINSNKRFQLSIYLLGLVLISNRGFIHIVAIFFYDLHKKQYKPTKSMLIGYFIPCAVFITFLVAHYFEKNWVGYSNDFPWAPSFEIMEIKGIIYNTGLMIWRYIDFGRIFIVGAFFILLTYYRKSLRLDSQVNSYLILLLTGAIFMAVATLPFSGLIGHRYYLPEYLLITLISVILISKMRVLKRWKNAIYIILLIGQLSGNLWLYPDKIAKGWDSTLGHLPYYSLQQDMLSDIKDKNINLSLIGSAFNNLNKQSIIDLSDDDAKMKQKDLHNDQYILYSNIWNDFSDEEISNLQNSNIWRPLLDKRQYPVKIILYQKVKQSSFSQ